MIHASGYLFEPMPLHGLEQENVSLLPVCSGYRSSDPAESPDYRIDRPDGRLDYQLLYIQSGEVDFLIGDKAIQAVAGQIVLIPPHIPHSYVYSRSKVCAVSWLHFTGSSASQILEFFLKNRQYAFSVGQSHHLTELFRAILLELQRKDPEFIGIATGLTQQLLYYVLRKRITQSEASMHLHDDRIDRSIMIMREQYAKPWTCEKLAAQVNLSPSRYIHLFTEIHHIPPLHFLNNIRLRMAEEFLGIQGLTVSEVSSMAGFQSRQYFCRMFRKATGMTPTEYREKME